MNNHLYIYVGKSVVLKPTVSSSTHLGSPNETRCILIQMKDFQGMIENLNITNIIDHDSDLQFQHRNQQEILVSRQSKRQLAEVISNILL